MFLLMLSPRASNTKHFPTFPRDQNPEQFKRFLYPYHLIATLIFMIISVSMTIPLNQRNAHTVEERPRDDFKVLMKLF